MGMDTTSRIHGPYKSTGTVQAGRGSGMVRGECSWCDMGPLICLDTTLTGDRNSAHLSTEVQPSVSLSESAATTSNKEPFNKSQIPKRLKQKSKSRKRRAKEQKAEIEIKMTPHTPNKSYVHHTSEDEDMIVYGVDEDEHKQFKHKRRLLAYHNTNQVSKEMTGITAFNTV
ncbi:hypothetical protein TNCV_1219021 [Trichonephila clavipes]|nr:hypothetical protein TNCV_1219021 [Trichonephila clavipes]